MQISKIFMSLATASLITNTLAAPANGRDTKKRDDSDDDVVVVRIKTTVQNVQTNYHTVEGPVKTFTNLIINTSTQTVTRYTATVTSTVFGTPHTYTTVATTPVSAADVIPNDENEVKTSVATYIETTAEVETPATTTTDPAPQPIVSTSTLTSVAAAVTTSEDNDGPTITEGQSVPTSTDSWIIENVQTTTSNSICYVNYDYYYATESEAEETTTLTSTIYTTVTQA
ncbi:uncharacterized protein RJT20DRAFT_132313 [Scheffersomyces xylosifermentans]|uniref:uncharacterized protein n=1 Tax=Scheffersomyces xylosifermentans TaxID=1304137 RepID=UPI00315C88B4